MSYLDVPRIHFAGKFFSNPSTVDNTPTNYDPANKIKPEWNPLGFHHFRLEACKITAAVLDARGALKIAPADDSIIGGSVELSSSLPAPPKLVDLDTEWQSSSQIWGMKLAISNGTDAIEGSLDTATLRDLWFARVPGAAGLAAPSGSFQSILRDLKYGPSAAPGSSTVLNQFIGAGMLAIRFICYVYDTTSNTGKVVGTIGVADPAASQFLNARRLEPAAAVIPGFGPRIYVGNPYGPAPFKLDEARKRLIIDLGNSIPETSVAGARASKGDMKVLVTPTGKPDITIGTLDYTQAHYEITAGVEELPVTDAQIAVLKNSPVKITLDKPATQVILSERPAGSNLEAAETVLRMDPGDTATIDLFGTQFGQPKSGQLVSARVTTGGNRTAAGLAFTVLGGGKTDAKGKVQIKFTASDPGKVRAASKIDGQLYFVEVDWGTTKKGVAPDWRGRILVKVFDTHAAVAKPKWADVQDIFQEYARMYPGMKAILDLASQVVVQGSKDRIKATLSYSITDPRYMPISRDLSRDKKDLILRWIAAGAP
jgi:hypothetical protein